MLYVSSQLENLKKKEYFEDTVKLQVVGYQLDMPTYARLCPFAGSEDNYNDDDDDVDDDEDDGDQTMAMIFLGMTRRTSEMAITRDCLTCTCAYNCYKEG